MPDPVLAFLNAVSPLEVGPALQAPVEIVVPPSDAYFPLGEALALAERLPNVRLTVTRTLDHTRPRVSRDTLKDLAAVDRFVVRGLTAAG